MNIIKNYLTKNRCYQQAVKRTPIGIQLHTIGTGQGTAQSVADYWNQAAVSACVTYIVDCDTPGKILQCLPEEYYTWADAGYGNKNLITFEICESDYIKYTSGASYNVLDEAKFKADILRGYNTAVLLCADICNRYGWNPTDKLPSGLYLISSHDEGRQAGLSSSHVDPTHIWNRFGLTMDQFRKDVALAMFGTVITQPETETLYRVRKTWTDVSSQLFAGTLEGAKKACLPGYSVYDEDGKCVYTNTPKGFQVSDLQGLTEAERIAAAAPLYVESAKTTGMLPSVGVAQFCLESGYGTTDLAQFANNVHGMKCSLSGNTWQGSVWDGESKYTKKTAEQDSAGNTYYETADFRKYPCMEDSIADRAAYFTGAMNEAGESRYPGLNGEADYKKAIQIIKDGGYATDVSYVSKLCNLVERWNLTQYDEEFAGAVNDNTADILPETEEPWYRIRKAWADSKTQKGAYHDLDKAKACADANAGYYVFDEDGNILYPEYKEPSVPEKAADWAIATANDNSHGYNNTKGSRGGNPDYACSSFVNEAFRQAGVDLPESSTVYTAKMKSIYTKAGFEVVTDEVNLKNGKGLEIGDVVLAPGKHVEIYVGDGQLAGARGNANSGKPENGKAGDQTGGEITVSAYWNYPWTIVLRYVGIKTESGVTVPAKQYRVQAGAFTKKKNANTRIAKLKNEGFDAILKQEGDNFIVQSGLFNDKELAKELAAQIRARGIEAIVKEV